MAEVEANNRKLCSRCGLAKPQAEFGIRSKANPTLRPECKTCCLVVEQEWRDRKTPAYLAMIERRKIALRVKRAAMTESEKAAARILVRPSRRKIENKCRDATNLRRRLWRKLNPHKARSKDARRRVSSKASIIAHGVSLRTVKCKYAGRETLDYIKILLSDPCSYCGSTGTIHIDHITPVSRGGGLEWENLAASCPSCNQRKNARPLLMFLLESA